MKNNFKLITTTLLAMVLTGCGFHLRGDVTMPPQYSAIYIDTKKPYDNLSKSLRAALNTTGMNVTDSAKNAPITLKIISETNTQGLGNIGTNTTTRIYSLQYQAKFALLNSAGKPIAGPFIVTQTQSFDTSSNQILSFSTAELNLQAQMEDAAASQIINILIAPGTIAKVQAAENVSK